jgi:predicted nucleic acid-binding protein
MQKGVVIDSSTMTVLANPNGTPEAIECREWAENLRRKGALVTIPAVVNYECRRKLVHINSTNGIAKLDETLRIFGSIEMSEDAWTLASHMWARMRSLGRIATDDRIDADVLIAAQATLFAMQKSAAVTVATDNIRHFLPLVDGTHLVGADEWRKISP